MPSIFNKYAVFPPSSNESFVPLERDFRYEEKRIFHSDSVSASLPFVKAAKFVPVEIPYIGLIISVMVFDGVLLDNPENVARIGTEILFPSIIV